MSQAVERIFDDASDAAFPTSSVSPFALMTTMNHKKAFPPNMGSSHTTDADRPEQPSGTGGVWETVAFLTSGAANTATKCKMKPAHSCTFWRLSP